MAHSYRLHGACNLEVPGLNPRRAGYFSSWLCIYSAPNCSKAWGVYSAAYATVYYTLEVIRNKSRAFRIVQISFFSTAGGILDHLAVISEIDCCKTKWNKEKYRFEK